MSWSGSIKLLNLPVYSSWNRRSKVERKVKKLYIHMYIYTSLFILFQVVLPPLLMSVFVYHEISEISVVIWSVCLKLRHFKKIYIYRCACVCVYIYIKTNTIESWGYLWLGGWACSDVNHRENPPRMFSPVHRPTGSQEMPSWWLNCRLKFLFQ